MKKMEDSTCWQFRLRNESLPNNLKGQYKKWLQYYLDFCSKYHFPHIDKNSLPRFILQLNPLTLPLSPAIGGEGGGEGEG